MNKAEAILRAREGYKISGPGFEKNEWFTIEGDTIVLEDGVRCSEYEFWRWRREEYWNDGYSIWEDEECTKFSKQHNNPLLGGKNDEVIMIKNYRTDQLYDHRYEGLTKKEREANIQPVRTEPKVGRNEPCPCGSGKKFKHCCI